MASVAVVVAVDDVPLALLAPHPLQDADDAAEAPPPLQRGIQGPNSIEIRISLCVFF